MLRRSLLSALLALAASGAARAAEPMPVVATFSILGDIVRQVGGTRVAVTTLVGPDGDAHVYSPTPSDAATLSRARIVVVNGLGMEGWIDRLVKSSGTRATSVEASRGVKPLAAEEEPGHHAHAVDPHAWQNVANVKIYAANIRDALSAADPEGRAAYEANTAAFSSKLDALDADVRAAVARVPAGKRRIITSHDAFRYFAAAYGMEFIAPQGVSTETEASAADVARIIRQIRREKIPAVFMENISDPRLVERIAKETGARIGERVYSDALSGPDGPAATYIDMMRHNIKAFAAALSS